jgi:hypothetical protein
MAAPIPRARRIVSTRSAVQADSTIAESGDIRTSSRRCVHPGDSRGTAGRVLHDSAAFSALGEAHAEMTLLLADLKKHPLRYNPF